MQTLFIKSTDGNEKTKLKEIVVLRSWQLSSGEQIYLHKNGMYGYKSGAPVRSAAEFDKVIGDPLQRKYAHAWWQRTGKAMSEAYYSALEREMEERAGEIQVVEGPSSELDSIQYVRRPIKDRKKSALSQPCSWMDWFPARPDWWGAASIIEIAGYRYQIVEPDSTEIQGGEEKEDPDSEVTPDQEKKAAF